MRRKLFRIFAISLVLFVLVDLVSCQIFDAMVVPVEAEGLLRDRKETSSDWTVSYLSAMLRDQDELQRIIYVHGTPGDATAFEGYLLKPIDGFDSIAVDRPGFGHTTPKKPALTMHEQAQAIEPFLVERNGKWPILVGHSMGAPIIARVAAEYPEKVGGLVILSGALDPSLEKIAWFQRVGEFAIVPYMIPRFLRNSNRELYTLRGELEALKPLLAEIKCPVIIVHAPDDMLVPYDNVEYMQENFSEGVIQEVVVVDGKNHFLPWNAEETVREAILQVADDQIDEKS